MALLPKEKLIDLLKQKKVIPFIGAGFSSATAEVPGWATLIKNGLEYARVRNIDTDNLIEKSEEELAKNNLLVAANFMKKVLNAPSFAFSNWIKEEFQDLKIVSSDLINSVLDLNQEIIFTTNYDTLLTSYNNIDNKELFIHNEYELALNSLKLKKEFVMHLHGIFSRPDSIILSKNDYDLINKNLGYKSFMQKMFSDYHFLFIGCSKDGVMDEDFLIVFNFIKEWFSHSSNQHFILLHEKEVTNQNHVRLLTECNIEAIVYGTEYNQLSPFINSINPNYLERKEKISKYKEKLDSEFTRLAINTENFKTGTSSLESFLSTNLNSKYDWIDSEKMKVFENILSEYNSSILDKKEKLKFTQTIILSIFNISELKAKVDLWKKNGEKPENLNPLNFISTGILAYECLQKIPKDILRDIQFSEFRPIHPYFFDNYLGGFIWEIQNLKKIGIDLEKRYKDDKYLFENLKRIIDSLRGFLNLDPDNIYATIGNATIVKALPNSFIVITTDEEITIRDKFNFNIIYSKLPLEKGAIVRKIETIIHNENVFIIGFNSKYCFYWKPQEELVSFPFCNSEGISGFNHIFSHISKENKIKTQVKYGKTIKVFEDFKEIKTIKLDNPFEQLIQLENNLLALKSSDSTYKGPFLFSLNTEYVSTELLTVQNLIKLIKKNPKIIQLLNSIEMKFEDDFINLIDNFKLYNSEKCKLNSFIIKARIHLDEMASILIFCEINNGIVEINNIEILINSICNDIDIWLENDQIQIIASYLDIHRSEIIGEYLNGTNILNLKVDPIILDRQHQNVRDMFTVNFLSKDEVVFNEEGQKLISYSLINNETKTLDFEDKRISCIVIH